MAEKISSYNTTDDLIALLRTELTLICLASQANKGTRAPPPPPTPLDFPCWKSSNYSPYTEVSAKSLYSLCSAIQKPADVSGSHLDALNLCSFAGQELDDIVPWRRPDGTHFLPSRHWGENRIGSDENKSFTEKVTLCNGREAPGPDIYQSRIAELTINNGDGFRAVQRLPPEPGKKEIRPGYFYRFWQNLLLMSQYWDTSLDEEFDEEEVEDDAKNEGVGEDAGGSQERGSKRRIYKGRRTGTGKGMPDQFREDTVRALVDTITWQFGCQTSYVGGHNPLQPNFPRLLSRRYD